MKPELYCESPHVRVPLYQLFTAKMMCCIGLNFMLLITHTSRIHIHIIVLMSVFSLNLVRKVSLTVFPHQMYETPPSANQPYNFCLNLELGISYRDNQMQQCRGTCLPNLEACNNSGTWLLAQNLEPSQNKNQAQQSRRIWLEIGTIDMLLHACWVWTWIFNLCRSSCCLFMRVIWIGELVTNALLEKTRTVTVLCSMQNGIDDPCL